MVTVAAAYGERAAPFGGLWRFGRPAGMAALILILCFLTLYPMAMLLYGSLHSTPPGIAGDFNLDGYAGLASAENLAALVNTVGISLVKTILSLALAVLLAWIMARTDTPGRGVLEVLITLPFFIPPILTATAWAMLGNAQVGTINLAWRWLTGTEGTLVDVYSYGGVVWHMMQYSTPFIFLFVVDAFRAMDPSLEESSRMSGATRWQTFWRITFGADAAGHHQRLHPELHPRHGVLRIGGVLRHAGRHQGDHDGDLQFDHPARPARLPVGHGAGLRRHGADVPAAGAAKPPAARPQLHHRDRQGLFAQRHAAGRAALGDLRGLHRLLRPHRGAAGRPAPAELVLPVLRLLPGSTC